MLRFIGAGIVGRLRSGRTSAETSPDVATRSKRFGMVVGLLFLGSVLLKED